MKIENTIIECGLSIGLKKVYGLCSGGKDSISACATAHKYRPLDGIILVDTTIVAKDGDNKPSYIASKKFAEQLGVPFICIKPKDDLKKGFEYVKCVRHYGTGKTYENYCKKYGFPHASQHNQAFRFLKKKALVGFVMDQTTGKEKIGFISGIRRKESKRRMQNSQLIGIDEDTPRIIWIAPIYYWTTEEAFKFVKNSDYKLSESYTMLHLSGDCLCGAYASRDELGLLATFYKDTGKQIEKIEKIAFKGHSGSQNWGSGGNMKSIKEQTKLSESFVCSECEINSEVS